MNQSGRELDILAVLVTNGVAFPHWDSRCFLNLPPLVAGVDTAVGSLQHRTAELWRHWGGLTVFGRHPVCDPDCLHLWNAGGCTLAQLQRGWWAVYFRIWQNLQTIRYFQLAENFSADTLLMPTERKMTDLCWQQPDWGKNWQFGLKTIFEGRWVSKLLNWTWQNSPSIHLDRCLVLEISVFPFKTSLLFSFPLFPGLLWEK